MTIPISDRAKRTCETFLRDRAAGQCASDIVGRLAANEGVRRPAIWRRLRSGGALPPYRNKEPMGHKAAGLPREHRAFVVAGYKVDRDPCQRCGVRADIGCGHSRAPLGMAF